MNATEASLKDLGDQLFDVSAKQTESSSQTGNLEPPPSGGSGEPTPGEHGPAIPDAEVRPDPGPRPEVDSEAFAVVLSVTLQKGSRRPRLTGQILLQSSSLEDFCDVPVLILNPPDDESLTLTESPGGFELELTPGESRVSLLLKRQRAVVVPSVDHNGRGSVARTPSEPLDGGK